MSIASVGYMNGLEDWLVNNPFRLALQRLWEIPLLRRLGMDLRGRHVLELGCGNGAAANVLRREAASYRATDLTGIDPVDVTRLPADWQRSKPFTAVVSFGLLHHVPDWRLAVSQIAGVLPAGGLYALDDFTDTGLKRWFWRTFFEHPQDDRFSATDLLVEAARCGLRCLNWTTRCAGDVLFAVLQKA